MIVFDLRCTHGDVFEAWFASTAAFEEQRDRGLVACPLCGDTDIEKAVMAPRVAAKGNRAAPVSPDGAKAMLKALASAQAEALRDSRWVGAGFASEARAMHLGERSRETIHGVATAHEAKTLADEGIAVTPLPLPVTPPEATN